MPTTEYRELSEQQVLQLLSKPQPTLILFHVHPDGDAVGSAFALALWLKEMGSPAYCVCADEIPERLAFLTEGLQQSVLPTSVPQGFENARIVTVDSASPAQLGALYELFGDRISLMIDHHGRGTRYADNWVVPTAATGELIYDLIAASGVQAPARCGELLYAAITTDTGGFRYSNTTPQSHLRAAALLESGVDTARLNHLLLETKSHKQLSAEHAAFERMHLYREGKIAIIAFPYELKKALELEDEHLGTLSDLARSVQGVEIAVAIRQPGPEPVFRVSTRTSIEFDVSAVCAVFGGGGHPRAAGATLSGLADINAAEAALLAEIEKRL